LLTPLYLAVSWILTVSYQLFTNAAVSAIAFQLNFVSPSTASWINSNLETIVFVYAFTWIFVLSSAIPSVLLGKERSVLIQYFVCLVLALLAFSLQGILVTYGGTAVQQLLSNTTFLNNPIIAGFYLAIPYLVMVAIDLRSRRKRRTYEKTYLENSSE
jgi:hypothetical protein